MVEGGDTIDASDSAVFKISFFLESSNAFRISSTPRPPRLGMAPVAAAAESQRGGDDSHDHTRAISGAT